MIVVDVETTGLDPTIHSIVSIGAVDFYNPKNQFYGECRIWPGAEITKEFLEINGFSEEAIKDPKKPTLEELIKEFFKWTERAKDKTLAGLNPSFDRDFLRFSANFYGIEYPLGKRTIDLHTLCYTHYLIRGIQPPTKNRRTDLDANKIFEYVGLPHPPAKHHALTDAKMEAEAISRLLYGKSLLPEFNHFKIPDYLLSHNRK